MEIKTKYHGTRNYSQNDIITFKNGLPGFETLIEFILFPVPENEMFSVLQSTKDPAIGLIVVSPFIVCESYEFDLKEPICVSLNIRDMSQVNVYNTVTLSSKAEDITTNLKAPIIINIKEKIGQQIILDDDKYKIRHPLFEEAFHVSNK